MNHRQRYLIKQNSPPRLGKPARLLLYFLMAMAALLYSAGFVYYATEPDPFLDRIEGR